MASMDDDLTIEGTVYSEMLGALDLSAMSMLNANRAAFPGSSLCYEYGGDPDFIPDMTWEDLKEYHNLYYHPSNCMAYLYGQFEDYAAFLALLDEAFAPYEKKEFSTEQPDYTAITAPVVQKIGFPTEADSSAENQTAIWYYIVCPGMRQDRQAEQVMDNLTSLLNSESSLLMQNLKKALPTGSFSVGREVAAPDDAIAFTAMNVNENDAELFVQTIEESLRQIAETGFPQDMVDGYMATVSLNTKLTAESKEVGTNIIRSIAYSYATTGEPFKYFTDVEILDQLDAWNQEGLYQKAIADWLLDRETTALVTTYPMPGEKEAKDAALAARLAEIKAGMTEEEKQAIIDATNAEDTDEDTSAMVSQLQAVTVESLPEEVKLYDVSDAQGEDGIRRVNTVAGVDGVGRVALFLDAQGLPQEDIHWFKLFMDMIGKLDTDAHTKEELDVLASRYLYGSEVRLSLMGDGENYHPYLRMGWTGMDDDLSTAYDLMYELVFGTQFTDAQKLLEKVQAAKTSLRSSINNSPYNVLLYRALSIANPLYRYYSYINFVDYYAFLEQVEAALEQSPETVLAKLQAIQATMNNSTNAVIGFAGNEKSIAVNAPLADAFMARLGSAPIEAVSYDLPVPAKREALIVDSSVQYNALVADYAALGMEEYDASLDAVMTLISDTFLIPQLRDQYGVYTPWAGAITDGGVYLLTYRDPNVRETFTVYESLPEQVAALDVDQETLDGYILSSYAYYATSEGELTGAMSALTATINGDAQDKALEYMRELKAMTPESVSASAKMFQLLAENGIRSTAGSASAINANADLYDVILNPFNAKDTSDVVFTDLTEDSPYTAAARFMMDNGLMTPKAEDSFGAMEEANVGDFAVPLSILNGGASDPEGAVQFLISAGLFTSDTLVTEELPREDLIAIGNMLSGGALEIQLPESDAVNATRGDVALMYYQMMN